MKQKVHSVEQSEGVGARVRRSIGRSELRNFDPFLLLDEGRVKRPAGNRGVFFLELRKLILSPRGRHLIYLMEI